jgi:transcriptional regulator with PAS, ATPase and Fis domain
VIQEKEVQPIGSEKTVKIDLRVISATNEALDAKVRKHLFRADLYYRLHVVNIELPPLRQRPEDIPLLIAHFLEKYERPDLHLAVDTLKKLQHYPWPGNIRELENVVHRAIALNEGNLLLPEDLPQSVQGGPVVTQGLSLELPLEGLNLDAVEKSFLHAALSRTNGNQSQAAKLLGLTRPAFIYRMEKHGLR